MFVLFFLLSAGQVQPWGWLRWIDSWEPCVPRRGEANVGWREGNFKRLAKWKCATDPVVWGRPSSYEPLARSEGQSSGCSQSSNRGQTRRRTEHLRESFLPKMLMLPRTSRLTPLHAIRRLWYFETLFESFIDLKCFLPMDHKLHWIVYNIFPLKKSTSSNKYQLE